MMPPVVSALMASVAALFQRGAASPESRDVILQFGTNLDNFGLIHLRWLARDRPHIRVMLQLWDVGRQWVARSQVGSGDCTVELDVE
jgi:hypothetical protein